MSITQVWIETNLAAPHFGVGKPTLRRWIDQGLIKGRKIGRHYFVHFSEIPEFNSNPKHE